MRGWADLPLGFGPLGPFPFGTRLRYDGRDVRPVPLIAIALALAGLAAACSGGGGPAIPTAEGPTTITLEKTVVETGEGTFRFTLVLTNTGANAAVNVTTSDVWEEGLRVESVGAVDGQQPETIGDFGVEFTFAEFEPGRTAQMVYTAECTQSGEWDNVAVSSATNSEPAQTVVTVACP